MRHLFRTLQSWKFGFETRNGWAESANATSVLCRPPYLSLVVVQVHSKGPGSNPASASYSTKGKWQVEKFQLDASNVLRGWGSTWIRIQSKCDQGSRDVMANASSLQGASLATWLSLSIFGALNIRNAWYCKEKCPNALAYPCRHSRKSPLSFPQLCTDDNSVPVSNDSFLSWEHSHCCSRFKPFIHSFIHSLQHKFQLRKTSR